MQMVKFPVRATIGRVLINALMMSDGGRYWGHSTCDTDENDQLNARSVLTTGEPGRRGDGRREPPWPLAIHLDEAVMRKRSEGWFKLKILFIFFIWIISFMSLWGAGRSDKRSHPAQTRHDHNEVVNIAANHLNRPRSPSLRRVNTRETTLWSCRSAD